MTEHSRGAFTTKPVLQSGPVEMLSTHCVVMEQSYRHQGKTNATTSGVIRERQTTLVINTGALTFVRRNRTCRERAKSVLQALSTSAVLISQTANTHSKHVHSHRDKPTEHQLQVGGGMWAPLQDAELLPPTSRLL